MRVLTLVFEISSVLTAWQAGRRGVACQRAAGQKGLQDRAATYIEIGCIARKSGAGKVLPVVTRAFF
jgi:hypothetical protein